MAPTALLRRLGPAALGLALAAGSLAGCGGGTDDVSDEKFREDFTQASGLRTDIADCVVDDLLAQLDQDDITGFYGEEGTELSDANQKAQDDAVRRCTAESISTTTAPG